MNIPLSNEVIFGVVLVLVLNFFIYYMFLRFRWRDDNSRLRNNRNILAPIIILVNKTFIVHIPGIDGVYIIPPSGECVRTIHVILVIHIRVRIHGDTSFRFKLKIITG